MENFPGNSHSAKKDAPVDKVKAPAPKKVEKVVTGSVVRRKKPLGKRFSETFVGGDAKSVWAYIAMDVLIPGAKDIISDAVSQGIDKMLFGEARGSRSRGGSIARSAGQVAYNRFANPAVAPRREDPRTAISRRARATHNFDEIILATRVEAEEVIDGLFNLVSQYETATVADLYELLGESGNFTDEKWGWTDIRGAGVTRVKGGYLLDLPRPEPLD